MGVIVFPAPAVFRRTTPMLVVFGAFVAPEARQSIPTHALDALAAFVTEARTFRVRLAFSRYTERGGGALTCWNRSCRPRISEPVFDHPEPSCFSNSEFRGALDRSGQHGITFCGLAGDPAYEESIRDSVTFGVEVSRSDICSALHKSSTMGPLACNLGCSIPAEHALPSGTSSWLDRFRTVRNCEESVSKCENVEKAKYLP